MNSLVCIKRVSTRLETGGGGVTVTDNCKTATTITCKHKPNRQACASGRFFKHRNIHTCSACSWIQRLTGCARTFCIHETEEVNADKGAGGEISPYRIFLCLSAPYWLLRYFPLKVFRHLWFRLDVSLSSLTQKRCTAVQCTMQNVQHMQGGTTCLWVQEKFRWDVQRQMLNSQILIWAHHKSHADPSYCDKVFRWIHYAFLKEFHQESN